MKWFSRTPFAALLMLVLSSGMTTVSLAAEKQYGPGVTDTEIKIGQTMPYSGPASSYGVIGKSEAAYFAMINEQGGINGRKINLISRDDGYSPPKTLEVTRQLVEQDQILLTFNALGTPTQIAIRDYLNEQKVPQLFVASGASKFNDPKHYPWTTPGIQPIYRLGARIYARYIIKNLPDAKIAVLYQNDDLGKDYLDGLREGLGDRADKMIVATQSYESSDPTVDSQVLLLRGSGANVLFTAAGPKFAAQTIRKLYDLDWKPTHILSYISTSVGAVLKPAGPEKCIGIISAYIGYDVADPQWQSTDEYKEWLAWMNRYNTSGKITDGFNGYGYGHAQAMVAVLKASGDNLTRENVLKQATSIRELRTFALLPGITVSTSPDDFAPIKKMQMERFDGTSWQFFGEVISATVD